MNYKKAFVLVLLFFSSRVFGISSVWKVEKDGKYFYVGGTVHILRESDYPLPEEFETAFSDSDVLVLEADPDELTPEKTGAYIREHGMYPEGESLKDHLSKEAYKEFRDYCSKNQISVMGLMRLKPSLIMTVLMAQRLQELKTTKGVDFYFFNKNKEAKRKFLALETPEFQFNLIVSMGEGQESDFILSTLKDMETLGDNFVSIIESWKKGDAEGLYEYQVKSMEKESPELYKSLLLDRNANWLLKIDDFAKTEEKEFILVGAAHLVGPHGLLEELRKKGYKITQVEAGGSDSKGKKENKEKEKSEKSGAKIN